jgi:hypothetical protein
VSVWDKQLYLIRVSLRVIFFKKKISLLLNLAQKVALMLTSDLFNVLSPLLCGIKSDFLDFPWEATPAPRDKTAKLEILQR